MTDGEGLGGYWLPSLPDLLKAYDLICESSRTLKGAVNAGALESALARPRQLVDLGGATPTPPMIGVAIAWSILRSHPLADGNKRLAFAVVKQVLVMNGLVLTAKNRAAARTIEKAARNAIDEAGLLVWVERNSGPPWPTASGP